MSIKNTDKYQTALKLAKMHRQVESEMLHIFLLEPFNANDNKPIKLLEVVKNAVEAGVRPIEFGPAAAMGIRYGSIIIEVSEKEFSQMNPKAPVYKNWTRGYKLV